MMKGYKYPRTKCPHCNKMIADNWYIRHLKKYHPVVTSPQLSIEGNNGGDRLDIQWHGENLVKLKVGCCCVYSIDHIVPVEFITAVLTDAILNADGVKNTILSLDWPDDFKQQLASQVIDISQVGLTLD